MAVKKSHRRTLNVNGRPYIWRIVEGFVGEFMASDGKWRLLIFELHVYSEDKKFNVMYPLNQDDLPEPYQPRLRVVGTEFPGLASPGGPGRFIATPRWHHGIGNRYVRELILWCMDETIEKVEVDQYGLPLALKQSAIQGHQK